MNSVKEYLRFALKVAIAISIIGLVLDAFALATGVSFRKYLFSPLQALGIYTPAKKNPATPATTTT